MHVSGKEVKASDITGRQNDAKRPSVKILLNIYVPVMYLVRGKLRPPSPHPLFTRNIPLGHLLSFCHIAIKKMRSP